MVSRKGRGGGRGGGRAGAVMGRGPEHRREGVGTALVPSPRVARPFRRFVGLKSLPAAPVPVGPGVPEDSA